MAEWKIKRETAESILLAARNTYPYEFISMLGGNKKEKFIDELVVLPANFGKHFSQIHTHLMPIDKKILGSVHSHPSYSNRPSRGDVNAFAKLGEVHFIVCNPFGIGNINAYNAVGREISFTIV